MPGPGGMDRVIFKPGEVILLDGLYGCSHDACELKHWGTAGRRFPRLTCGHEADYKLIRRRVDHWW